MANTGPSMTDIGRAKDKLRAAALKGNASALDALIEISVGLAVQAELLKQHEATSALIQRTFDDLAAKAKGAT